MLDERGTAFHPITIIAVQYAVDFADLRSMDMPADHAIRIPPAGLSNHGMLKVADVLHSVLDFVF